MLQLRAAQEGKIKWGNQKNIMACIKGALRSSLLAWKELRSPYQHRSLAKWKPIIWYFFSVTSIKLWCSNFPLTPMNLITKNFRCGSLSPAEISCIWSCYRNCSCMKPSSMQDMYVADHPSPSGALQPVWNRYHNPTPHHYVLIIDVRPASFAEQLRAVPQ